MARMDILSLVTLIILSFAIYGLNYYSGHPDLKSGGMGVTSEGLRAAFASYELSQGENIHYEWESNSLVRFVITANPYHPELAEFVNTTGLSGKGSFASPANATYYLQVTFLEVPPGSEARINYMTCRVTEFSEFMIIGMPVILVSLTVVLAGLLSWNWKKRKTGIEIEGKRGSLTFWHFFVADYKNWIAVVVGAVLLVSDSILRSIDTNHLDHSYLVEWLNLLGGGTLFWGLVFGLWLSHSSYKARKLEIRSLP